MCLFDSGDVECGLCLFIEYVLKVGDVFVDVGVNIGLYIVVVVYVVGFGGKVIVIEVMLCIFEYLWVLLWLSGVELQVKVLLVVLGVQDEDGCVFYVGVVVGYSLLYLLDEEVEIVWVDV